VSAELDGEFVVLNVTSGTYYGLGAVAAHVWALIQEPRSVQEIEDRVLQEFDVDQARCRRDVLAFLQQLADKGLIHISGESVP
jgi:DNA-directed RNA polymerase subunit N (RpoN/RPB10)